MDNTKLDALRLQVLDCLGYNPDFERHEYPSPAEEVDGVLNLAKEAYAQGQSDITAFLVATEIISKEVASLLSLVSVVES